METIILIIVLAVIFVALVLEGGWLLFVRPRRRRGGPVEVVTPPEAPGRDELRTPGEGAADAAGDVIAPPAPARGVPPHGGGGESG